MPRKQMGAAAATVLARPTAIFTVGSIFAGATATGRVLQSLMVALRPLEKWISEDGWS